MLNNNKIRVKYERIFMEGGKRQIFKNIIIMSFQKKVMRFYVGYNDNQTNYLGGKK